MGDISPGESAAATIDGAIATAEARADAAEAVNEALTEAALRDRLSGRIDDCEEGISTCQSDLEETQNEIQELQITSNLLSLEVARLNGALIAQAEQIAALILSQSTPQHSREVIPPRSEVQTPPINPENPPNEGEEGREEAEPERAPVKRGRLI